MKTGYTKVVMVIDRSGSMNVIRDAMVEAINGFVVGLKEQPGKCDVLAVQFDSANPYEVLFDKPLEDVKPIGLEDYVPRGMTPLYYCLGRAIQEVGEQLSATPEEDRPEHVVVCVITDGEENDSQHHIYRGGYFDQRTVAEMVKHQQDVYKWAFTLFGANQDAVLTANVLNIPAEQAVNFAAQANSMPVFTASAALFSNNIRRGRSASASASMSYTKGVRSHAMNANQQTAQDYQVMSKVAPELTPEEQKQGQA